MDYTKEQIYSEIYGARIWDALNNQTRLFNTYRKDSWPNVAYWNKEEYQVETVIPPRTNIKKRRMILD